MSDPHAHLIWRCRDRELALGPRAAIMGVLNVTPDSFSDGGRFVDIHAALARGREIAAEGADIIDIGGESSRPGALPVDAEEELRRVIPVVEKLAAEVPCLISVDTTKAIVARRALEKGAHIINDISAMAMDPAMARVAKDSGAGVVLMHMRGTPQTMQTEPVYDDVVRDVRDWLAARVEWAAAQGIDRERIAVDPGIGFGKTGAHNIRILAGLDAFRALGRPVIVGLSRKSFLGAITGRGVNQRGAASLAGLAYAIRRGAHVARVHDVIESCDVAKVVAILASEEARR